MQGLNQQGAPKTSFAVVDGSNPLPLANAGWIALQIIAQRGRAGKAYYINNPYQFTRLLGKDFLGDKGPTFALRILNAGGKVIISRAFHYTDPTDITTVVGTKSTGTISTSAGAHTSVWRGEAVGPGYDGTTIVITAAASGKANSVDIVVTLNQSDISTTLTDITMTPAAADIIDINNKLKGFDAGVELVSVTVSMDAGNCVFAGGVQALNTIVAADYTGSALSGTGWNAFDSVTESARIFQIGIESEAVDTSLQAYCENRQDMRFAIHTPLGVNSAGMLAYRNGTTPYAHAKMDTVWGDLFGGDINVNDITDTDATYNIPGAVDVAYLKSLADVKYGPWVSAAGGTRGQLLMPNNGSPYNLGSAGLSGNYDQIYPIGVNAVIKDPQFGMALWGNRSLVIDPGKITSSSNVCDLLIDMIRTFKPMARKRMFDPNMPTMWKALYNDVKKSIANYETKQAIEPGEGTNWFWIGDQDAATLADAKFNTQQGLLAKKYKARFVFVPYTAAEYIGIELVASDNDSIQFNIILQPQL